MSRTATYRSIAVVAGFVLAVLMIATTSRAVWTDTTDNTGNQINSGEVVLTDDDLGNPLFSVTSAPLASPGDQWVGCIDVIYEGNVGADVQLTNITTTGDQAFADELSFDVDLHTSANCSDAAPTSVVVGDDLGAYTGGGADPAYGEDWAVSTFGDHRSYEITVTFNATAPNTTQNSTAGFSFLWTATSN